MVGEVPNESPYKYEVALNYFEKDDEKGCYCKRNSNALFKEVLLKNCIDTDTPQFIS